MTNLTSHTTQTTGGRTISWAERGPADGAPVLLLHRSPGSRLFDPDPEVTDAAGIRLITIDRPGYGGSDPVEDPTRVAATRDLIAVADELGLDGFALLGWSGGGSFAVEGAAELGGRVRSLSLLASPAPDDEVPWTPPEFRPLIDAIREDPVAAHPVAIEACAWYPADPDGVAASDPGPADAEVRERPGVMQRLVEMMREGARQGAGGQAFDIVAGSRVDPLPTGAVRAPAHLWYGDADFIGPEHGRWYAERIDGGELTVLRNAGHLLPVVAWERILEAALR